MANPSPPSAHGAFRDSNAGPDAGASGGARAVFAFKDLTGVDLHGRNLCDADFTGAILIDCNMRGARLDNATKL